MRLADSHVHLDHYPDARIAALLARAAAGGVHALLTVGVDMPSSARAVELARRFGASHGVRAAVGLHPAYLGEDAASRWPAELDALTRLARAAPEQVAALGEIGLDTVEAAAPLELQVTVFRAQLELAARLRVPSILHVRGASAHTAASTAVAEMGSGAGAVVHYFVGDAEAARRWLALGCHLSVGRPATRLSETALRAALAGPDVPLERLLLETDSYPLPGRATEPADVAAVAAALAELKGLPVEVIAATTTARFEALFGRATGAT